MVLDGSRRRLLLRMPLSVDSILDDDLDVRRCVAVVATNAPNLSRMWK